MTGVQLSSWASPMRKVIDDDSNVAENGDVHRPIGLDRNSGLAVSERTSSEER
jgi:hypothetical protein